MSRRIVVLISGSGSNLQALIDALNTPALPDAQITLVFSNRKGAFGLQRAANANPPIPTAYKALQPYLKSNLGKTREDYDAEVAKIVVQQKPDLVVLAGWMHILSESFLEIIDGRKAVMGDDNTEVRHNIQVINLHPALPGAFDGAHAIERAYEAFQKGEVQHSGCMVHRVVKDVDAGEPVVVREVAVEKGEPIERFEERLHKVEHQIIVEAAAKVLDQVKPTPLTGMPDCMRTLDGQEELEGPFVFPPSETNYPDAPLKRAGWRLIRSAILTAILQKQASLQPPPSFEMGYLLHPPIVAPEVPFHLALTWIGPTPRHFPFSGIFSEADIAGDVTRRTHESGSVSLDMSYDIQTFPNLKDVVPDFGNDSDISEVVFMTPKLPATLSTIPEAVEPSPALTYSTSLSDFEILNMGGTSDAGISVMVCKRRKTGKMYKIRCRRDHYPWTEQDILETLRDLGAPFLPHLRSSFREDGRVHLVLDHLSCGSLRNLVERTGTLSSQRVVFYACEIIVGISNLHSIGIMHRNLNPDDIMFDLSGHVVISNFEYADFVASTGQNSTALAFSGEFMSLQPRTQCYQAPEVLLGWSHDLTVDCWGFGMVLYYMYFGKHPFKIGVGPEGSEDLKARVIEGTLSPDSLRLIHPQTRDLILRCLERNPRIRLSLDEIKAHGFFTNVSWTKVADRLVEVPPFPGSFDKYMNKDHPPPTRYSSAAGPPSLPTYAIEPIQLAPVDVQPLRIEKKASRSPIQSQSFLHSNSGLGSFYQGEEGIESGLSLPSPISKTHGRLPRDGRSPEVLSLREAEQPLAHTPCGPQIWDILDQEDQERALSLRSGGTESGRKNIFSFFKSRSGKAPKGGSTVGTSSSNRASTLYPKTLFLNLSTVSFGRRKGKGMPASPSMPNIIPPLPSIPSVLGGATASSVQSHSNVNLPLGLEQIGSGIGFQYNLKPAAPSKTSIMSGAPRGCMFPSGRVASACVEEVVDAGVGRRSGQGAPAVTVAGLTAARGLGLACPTEQKDYDERRSQIVEKSSRGTLRDAYRSPAPGSSRARDTYHPGNSAVWIVPCLEDGVRGEVKLSPVVQAYMGQAVSHRSSPFSPSSSTPESAGGPFTPTVACDDGDDSKEFNDSCGVDGGTLEGKMEPDETLRLIRSSRMY